MRRLGILLLLLFFCTTLQAQKISEKVAGMEKFPGFLPFYWDAKAGKLLHAGYFFCERLRLLRLDS